MKQNLDIKMYLTDHHLLKRQLKGQVTSLTEQILECGAVVRHKVVNDGGPVTYAYDIDLEEVGIKEQLERLFLPGTPRVLVAAQTRHDVRAAAHARQVLDTKTT